jgi:hypothetical protein
VITTKGLRLLLPIKSPTIKTVLGSELTVITPVVALKLVAVIPVDLAIAPTHFATLLTREFAD